MYGLLEWDDEYKIIKKTIGDYINMFLAATFVGWTESLQRRTYF